MSPDIPLLFFLVILGVVSLVNVILYCDKFLRKPSAIGFFLFLVPLMLFIAATRQTCVLLIPGMSQKIALSWHAGSLGVGLACATIQLFWAIKEKHDR